MSKGYGNINPRFAKYFARHKNSSGPHDPKNAKQEALDKLNKMESMQAHHEPKASIAEMMDHQREAADEITRELEAIYDAPPEELFDVNEYVRIIAGPRENEFGRIVIRRCDKGDMSYGIVFDWDVAMIPFYVSGNQIERAR